MKIVYVCILNLILFIMYLFEKYIIYIYNAFIHFDETTIIYLIA